MRLWITGAALPALANAVVNQPWIFDRSTRKWVQNGDNWSVGANFIPSNAVNELEMFQSDTFDPDTIKSELGYAKNLGFNSMRVFLHNLLWENDSDGFIATVDSFLDIASSYDIGIMFVLLDSCWNPNPQVGVQPAPTPYVHNSQWVQAPGEAIVRDAEKFKDLKGYVTGIVSHFRDDSRIIAWDVWNEPDNSGYSPDLIAPLITDVFNWCREARPSQPLTTPLWKFGDWGNSSALSSLEKVQVSMSDVISFHLYSGISELQTAVESLQTYDKPVVCTEYMAREAGSYFEPHLGYMKESRVGAFNWGLVSGLTQTIYPWSSQNTPNPYDGIDDPNPWFHDILLADGTPKYPDETEYIKSLTL